MKYLILFTMSLFSLLFGCNTKKTPAKPQEWPRFPETDHPAAKVVSVPLDSGFWVKSFFITPEKQYVYVLGYRKIIPAMEEGEVLDPNQRDLADFRLYCLDSKGQIKHRLNLTQQRAYESSSFGLLGNQLMLQFGDQFLVLDAQKFAIQEKIPVYDTQYFPSKQEVEMMAPDEQRDAYQLLFDALLEKCTSCKWLHWIPGGQYYVFVQGSAGKRAAWSPMSYEDGLLADLKSRFDSIVPSMNPKAVIGDHFYCADGPAQLREIEYLSAGTELDYPNYKSRTVLQYEMIVGDKTLHFSTTDKKRHQLRVGSPDNLMLSTLDGCAWVEYEGILYRVE